MDGGLGRRTPTDWNHVEKHPLRLVAALPVAAEVTLAVPYFAHLFYDQGAEGACVGFGSSQMMSILNRHRYDARWLWNRAKEVDEWLDTNPGDDNGTSVRAAMDVLRTQGHVQVYRKKDRPADQAEGIEENRWATTVDEIRACVARRVPVTIGVNWYTAFDSPQKPAGKQEMWVGQGSLGSVRGGHCVCVMAASDRRQAFGFTNSWGASYPKKVWVPYGVMQRLLDEDGEATVVTDRLSASVIAR